MRIRGYEKGYVGHTAYFTLETCGLFPCSAVVHISKSLLGALITESSPLLNPTVQAGNTLASCDRYPMEAKASPV